MRLSEFILHLMADFYADIMSKSRLRHRIPEGQKHWQTQVRALIRGSKKSLRGVEAL